MISNAPKVKDNKIRHISDQIEQKLKLPATELGRLFP